VGDTNCPGDLACEIIPNTGLTQCTEVSDEDKANTQAAPCDEFVPGGCFLNGCADGYSPSLPDVSGHWKCTAFCRPELSFRGSAGRSAGALAADCSAERIGVASDDVHQCRYFQSFFTDAAATAESIGFCVPVTGTARDRFGDCDLLEWQAIQSLVAQAKATGHDPLLALESYCITDPSTLGSPLKPECAGLLHGCLTLAERAKIPALQAYWQ
jgi:hypothetical protein